MAGRVERRIIHLLPRIGWLPLPQERILEDHFKICDSSVWACRTCSGTEFLDMCLKGIYLVVGERNRSWKWLAGSWARCDGGRAIPFTSNFLDPPHIATRFQQLIIYYANSGRPHVPSAIWNSSIQYFTDALNTFQLVFNNRHASVLSSSTESALHPTWLALNNDSYFKHLSHRRRQRTKESFIEGMTVSE